VAAAGTALERNLRVRRPGAWFLGLALLGWPAAADGPTAAVQKVAPAGPADGAVVGSRPLFEVGYVAAGDPHPRGLRFRIRLERVGGGAGAAIIFDQRRRPSGWIVGEPGRVLYRPVRPLSDGDYRWEPAAWNGVEWLASGRPFAMRVDSVPPAAVSGLRIARLDQSVVLEWDPVTTDRDGRPEYVARYHVHRSEEGGGFNRSRQHEIGVVEVLRFVDEGPESSSPRILFYRVTAEDEAGNEGAGITRRANELPRPTASTDTRR